MRWESEQELFSEERNISKDIRNDGRHALRVPQVIATAVRVSCRHGLWLISRVNKNSMLLMKIAHAVFMWQNRLLYIVSF